MKMDKPPKNYKSFITLEVLHQGPFPDHYELIDIAEEAITGRFSHVWHVTHQVELTEPEMRQALEEQNSDPQFFFPDVPE